MRKLVLFCIMLSAIPFARAQWHNTNGPFLASNNIGMDVKQVVVSGDNLCAVINNQVYISYTNGASWMSASGGLNYIGAIAFSDSTIYAGAGTSGMYVSTNNGSSYRSINNNLPPDSYVDELMLSGNILLANVNTYDYPYIHDVYYSTDKGNTWTVSNGLANKYVKCLASDGVNFYAGTSTGVFKSSDNGLNWFSIGLANKKIDCIAVKENRLYVGENSTAGGLYITSDNGITWTKLDNGLPGPGINTIAISDNFVYVGITMDGIFRSADNGYSWTKINNGYSYSLDFQSLAVRGNNVYSGSSGGCAVSINNGTSWNCGLRTYDLTIRSIANSGANVITAASYMMYTSTDHGSSWETFPVSNNAVAANDSIVYAGGNGGFTISRDGGTDWNWMGIIGLPDNPKFSFIITNDSVTFAATWGKGVYYSKDQGRHWEARNFGLNDYTVNTLALADSILFAGSNSKGVFISHDSGLHWTAAGNGIPDTCIQALAAYNNLIYAGTKNHGIYKSTDNGVTWNHLENGVTGTDIRYLYTCGVNVFAGIRGEGLLMSANNGTSWAKYNAGLMSYNIQAISEDGNDIYVGTDGAGMWRRTLSELPLTLSFKKVKISDATICEGFPSTIKVDVIGGKPPYNYLWDNGSHTPEITVTPLTTTTYHLTITDSNSNSAATDVTIKVRPKPETPFITQSGDTLISSASEGNVWMFNNQVIYYAHSNKFVPTFDGAYSVVVNKNGCFSDTSNKVPVGIEEIQSDINIALYPNPATKMVTIENMSSEKDFRLTIYDAKGTEMLRKELTEKKTAIDIHTLNKGIYIVKLMNEKAIKTKLLVVQ